MKRTLITLLSTATLVAAILATTAPAPQAAQAPRTLDIYVVDTEGGGATLFVTPTGETVLLDSGNPGERDHQRLMEVLKIAGVTKIDHMINSHYHVDHIGGLQQLAANVPIAHYIDHGPTTEEREQVAGFQETYATLRAKARHTVVKPGDKLTLAGLDWTIVTSAGQALAKPLPGAGQDNSAACAATQAKPLPTNDPDNAASVGSLVQFGQFRTIHLGDLYWAKELEFMCPQNRLGTVDLYLVSHHGLDSSGSPALVHGLRPRVAVMQNGTRKGGAVATNRTLFSSPGFQDLWQLHWSYNAMVELNPPGLFIANVDDSATIAGILTAPPPAPRGGGGGRQGGAPGAAGPAPAPGAGAPAPAAAPAPAPAVPQAAAPVAAPGAGSTAPSAQGGARAGGGGRGGGLPPHTPAHYIKISAQANGTFTVTNSRNGFAKTYAPR